MGQFLNSGSILLSEVSLELRDRVLVTDNERLFNSSWAPLIYGDVITLISLSSSILPLMIWVEISNKDKRSTMSGYWIRAIPKEILYGLWWVSNKLALNSWSNELLIRWCNLLRFGITIPIWLSEFLALVSLAHLAILNISDSSALNANAWMLFLSSLAFKDW